MEAVFEVRSLAERFKGLLARQPIDQYEIYLMKNSSKTVHIENNEARLSIESPTMGVGIRAAKGGKVAFVSTTDFSEEGISRTMMSLSLSIEYSQRDPEFRSFTRPGTPSRVSGTYDERVAFADERQVSDLVKSIADSLPDGVTISHGFIRFSEFAFHVINSLGVDAGDYGTHVFAFFALRKGDVEYTGRFYSRGWPSELPAFVGKLGEQISSYEKAVAFKGKEEMTVIMQPEVLAPILVGSVGSACAASNVYHRRSPFAGMFGKPVASELLTVVDDGTLEGGIMTSCVDDEGFPTSRKVLIEKGVLRAFYYDSYYANLMRESPTGNAYRRTPRSPEQAYRRTPSNSASNIVVEPGDKTLDEMVSEVERGLLLERVSAPVVDPITGSMSLEVRNAVFIQNGSLGNPVRFCLVVANFYEALKNIRSVGKERAMVGNCFTPPIAFDSMTVVGTSS